MRTVEVRAALALFVALAAGASPLASCAGGVGGGSPETGDSGGGSATGDARAPAEGGGAEDAAPGSADASPQRDGTVSAPDAQADASTTGADDAAIDATTPDATMPDATTPDASDAAAADAAIPTTGLVGQWLCSGDTSDTSGTGNTGANTNVTFVADRHGNAMSACSFNGTSSVIVVPSAASLNVTTTWSLSAWVQPTSFSVLAGIASKYHNDNADGPTVRLSYDSPFTGIDVDESANVADAAAGLLAAGTWAHVGVTVNGTAVLCYVNGALAYSGTAGYQTKSNTDSFDIGLDYTNRFFAGAIDDVRFYNRTLSAAEIEALYLAP